MGLFRTFALAQEAASSGNHPFAELVQDITENGLSAQVSKLSFDRPQDVLETAWAEPVASPKRDALLIYRQRSQSDRDCVGAVVFIAGSDQPFNINPRLNLIAGTFGTGGRMGNVADLLEYVTEVTGPVASFEDRPRRQPWQIA